MKKIIVVLASLLCTLTMTAQNFNLTDAPNFEKYAKDNEAYKSQPQKEHAVVFIGNSITEGWAMIRPQFFMDNNYIGRGIGGQTSLEVLLRFRKDVVELKPEVVVINIGTNDIAENGGTYSPKFTFDNIKSMADIAKTNGIKVILSSVLPVGQYPWRKEIENVPAKIDALNANIKDFADKQGYEYIDYNSTMRLESGAMKKDLAKDGVHPTEKGYILMEKLATETISKVLNID